ncbi:hypothetical protein BDZ97DRAFT_209287 [Flammula alnicola]|nr:hypothetical protein BDZ97DRAFT_209287 [Flammula alnicola]
MTSIVVDDADPSIVYDPAWSQGMPQDMPLFQGTVHSANTSATLSYSFNGSIVVVSGGQVVNNSVTLEVQCFVDNKLAPPQYIYSASETEPFFCQKAGLQDGPHVITMNAVIPDQGSSIWLDYIQYFSSTTVPPEGANIFINSTDARLDFGKGWQPDTPGSLNKMTDQHNATLGFNFVGTSVSWFGCSSNDSNLPPAQATYKIDHQGSISFNLTSNPPTGTSSQCQEILFQTAPLPAGPHQLLVTYLGDRKETPLTLGGIVIGNATITSSSPPGCGSPVSDYLVPGCTSATTSSTVAPFGKDPSSTSAPIASTTAPIASTRLGQHRLDNADVIIGSIIGSLAFVLLALFALRQRRTRSRAIHLRTNPFLLLPNTVLPSQNLSPSGHTALNHSKLPRLGVNMEAQLVLNRNMRLGSVLRLQLPRQLMPQALVSRSRRTRSSRIVMHNDSGIRLSLTADTQSTDVVELPPRYTEVYPSSLNIER